MLQKLFWLSGTYTSMVLFIGKQVSSYSVAHTSSISTTWEAYVGSVNTDASTLWLTWVDSCEYAANEGLIEN